jgi:hypothetical protein
VEAREAEAIAGVDAVASPPLHLAERDEYSASQAPHSGPRE